ncbi:MAG TPA: hypothetical protein VK034_22805 [Enhygromyxa sp.]|nr:hypothetical protein [Enhygromyxa sp.]
MSPRLVVGITLALAGCGPRPDVRQLCGVWAGAELSEHWSIDGRDLQGEGRMIRDGVEITTERLKLKKTRAGHVYVAMPSDVAPTEFAPIDPATAKFGPDRVPAATTRFSWANYQHDFPQEIHYLVQGDRLTAIISGPDRESGFEFQRVTDCVQVAPP